MLVLGVMLAVGALEAPLPLLAGQPAQLGLVAVGLVLVAIEVRAILALLRSRRMPPGD